MKRKTFVLTLLAGVALAGCTNDDAISVITGPQTGPATEEMPILFQSNARTITRASHEESARLLGNQFYVFDEYETPLGVEIMINHVGDCFD